MLAAWVDEATAELARLTAAAVDDTDALFLLGRQLVERRELEPALGVLTRASRLDPARAEPWHERAAAEGMLGRYGRAAALLEAAPVGVRLLPGTQALHAFARLMDKDAGPARAAAPALAKAPDEGLRAQGVRLAAMLARHDALTPTANTDLVAEARAWHAVWTGEAAVDPLAAAPAGARRPAPRGAPHRPRRRRPSRPARTSASVTQRLEVRTLWQDRASSLDSRN